MREEIESDVPDRDAAVEAALEQPLPDGDHGVADPQPNAAEKARPSPRRWLSESPLIYSPERAAHYLGLYDLDVPNPSGTVYRYVKKGMLDHIMIAGRIGFLKSQLDEFIESRRSDRVERRASR